MKSIASEAMVELNRKALELDLWKLKKNIGKINDEVVEELDNYFDKICEMAMMDAQVFKNFFRRLIGKK